MMLTKGEEDQRGSRQPGVCATVPFKRAPCRQTQLGPSNQIRTGNNLALLRKVFYFKKNVKLDTPFQHAVNSDSQSQGSQTMLAM